MPPIVSRKIISLVAPLRFIVKNSAIYQYNPVLLTINYISYDYIKMAIENSSKKRNKKPRMCVRPGSPCFAVLGNSAGATAPISRSHMCFQKLPITWLFETHVASHKLFHQHKIPRKSLKSSSGLTKRPRNMSQSRPREHF